VYPVGPGHVYPEGFTIGIFLGPGTTSEDVDKVLNRVSVLVYEDDTLTDPFIFGQHGDQLRVDEDPDKR
jgi:hypothetical protein